MELGKMIIELENNVYNTNILPAILGYLFSGLLIYQFTKYKFLDDIPILSLSFIFLSSGFLIQLTVDNFDIIVCWANYSKNVISLPILTSIILTFLANRLLQSSAKEQEKKEVSILLKSIIEEHLDLEKTNVINGVTVRSVWNIKSLDKDLKSYLSFLENENYDRVFPKISNCNSRHEFYIYYSYNKQYKQIVDSVKKTLNKINEFSQTNDSVCIYNSEDIIRMQQDSKRAMIDYINNFRINYYIFMLWSLVCLFLIETKYTSENKTGIKEKISKMNSDLISHFGVKEYYACEFIQYSTLISNIKKANFYLRKINKISLNTSVVTDLNTPQIYISRLYVKRNTISHRERQTIKDYFSSIYFHNFIGFGVSETKSLNNSKTKFKKWLRDLDIDDEEIEKYLSYMTPEFYQVPSL
jgi:hypothetical protein